MLRLRSAYKQHKRFCFSIETILFSIFADETEWVFSCSRETRHRLVFRYYIDSNCCNFRGTTSNE